MDEFLWNFSVLVFCKSVKIHVSIKYDKNNGYLTYAHLWYLTEFFLE